MAAVDRTTRRLVCMRVGPSQVPPEPNALSEVTFLRPRRNREGPGTNCRAHFAFSQRRRPRCRILVAPLRQSGEYLVRIFVRALDPQERLNDHRNVETATMFTQALPPAAAGRGFAPAPPTVPRARYKQRQGRRSLSREDGIDDGALAYRCDGIRPQGGPGGGAERTPGDRAARSPPDLDR